MSKLITMLGLLSVMALGAAAQAADSTTALARSTGTSTRTPPARPATRARVRTRTRCGTLREVQAAAQAERPASGAPTSGESQNCLDDGQQGHEEFSKSS